MDTGVWRKNMSDIGILTFHCADNFGAMLQAYGLKAYLRTKNIEADIVPYEPPFMTGRYWWIPYVPLGSISKVVRWGWREWQSNLKLGRLFFERKRNMRQFRREYLIDKGQKRLFFISQLWKLPYQCFIVGSDQIWNPDITFGLKKEYFGVFGNKSKKKIIAYAASMGKEELAAKYDIEFSKLINSVDYISVREKSAIPYINRFCEKSILAVLDPVFLLRKDEWQRIEKMPKEKGYVFVYSTETNDELVEYAKQLAKRENLLIINVNGCIDIVGNNILTDYTTGPSEFLGYIHKADYIVTNSFHGVAFSIIFQKKFKVFQHSSLEARISNILEMCGMDKLHQNDREMEFEFQVDWNQVEERIQENVRLAEKYLMECLRA